LAKRRTPSRNRIGFVEMASLKVLLGAVGAPTAMSSIARDCAGQLKSALVAVGDDGPR
jgi:hypothetical protein